MPHYIGGVFNLEIEMLGTLLEEVVVENRVLWYVDCGVMKSGEVLASMELAFEDLSDDTTTKYKSKLKDMLNGLGLNGDTKKISTNIIGKYYLLSGSGVIRQEGCFTSGEEAAEAYCQRLLSQLPPSEEVPPEVTLPEEEEIVNGD